MEVPIAIAQAMFTAGHMAHMDKRLLPTAIQWDRSMLTNKAQLIQRLLYLMVRCFRDSGQRGRQRGCLPGKKCHQLRAIQVMFIHRPICLTTANQAIRGQMTVHQRVNKVFRLLRNGATRIKKAFRSQPSERGFRLNKVTHTDRSDSYEMSRTFSF